MKIIAIIQARMDSTRLPKKVMMDILGRPMIEWVVKRVGMATLLDDIVVATTINAPDNVLVEWCKNHGIKFFRGSESDVLSRFFYCAQENKADIIVRITADDPLKDSSIIDEAISLLLSSTADYCSNTINPTYPEGLDVEVFTYGALKKSFTQAQLESEREHVTPFIWKNKDKFEIAEIKLEQNLSAWRWTVDNSEDLEFIRLLLESAGGELGVGYLKLVDLVKSSPKLTNRSIGKTVRNAGYLKSLKMESKNNE
jgi:spore coat polysaccharide biosynthesis protein SpsF (cytidylyltransferase family)